MLVRMYPDVIALEPAVMVILAGTNDIARNNGPQTLEMTNSTFADYYTVTVDAQGEFRSGYTNDGLHPNARGYQLMSPVVATAIEGSLR